MDLQEVRATDPCRYNKLDLQVETTTANMSCSFATWSWQVSLQHGAAHLQHGAAHLQHGAGKLQVAKVQP